MPAHRQAEGEGSLQKPEGEINTGRKAGLTFSPSKVVIIAAAITTVRYAQGRT